MTIPADSVIKTNVKATLTTAGFDFNQAPLTEALIDTLIEEIMSAVKLATVATTVTVASVSGVTVGAGVSGPGAGTGSGGIT